MSLCLTMMPGLKVQETTQEEGNLGRHQVREDTIQTCIMEKSAIIMTKGLLGAMKVCIGEKIVEAGIKTIGIGTIRKGTRNPIRKLAIVSLVETIETSHIALMRATTSQSVAKYPLALGSLLSNLQVASKA